MVCFWSIIEIGGGFCLSTVDKMLKTVRASGGIPVSSLVLRRLVFVKVSLSSRGEGPSFFSCSCTIISKKHILTAAHCISSPKEKIGSIEICENTKYERDCKWKYSVDKCVVPRRYRYGSHDIRHDIAVCKLSYEIKRSKESEMRLLTSSKQIYFDYNRVFLSGAGSVSVRKCQRPNNDNYFNTLRLHLLLYGKSTKSVESSNGKQIKGSAVNRAISQCGAEYGDRGGPLYVLIGGIPYLFGVVSAYVTSGFRRNKISLFSNIYSVRYNIKRFVYNGVVNKEWKSIYYDITKDYQNPYFDPQYYSYVS